MKKYIVTTYNYAKTVYDGFDEETALEIWHEYNDACGDYILDEYDFEEPEMEDERNYTFYENSFLTDIYGADDNIYNEMKLALEYVTGRKIISFELNYDEPVEGENASFSANDIIFEDEYLKIVSGRISVTDKLFQTFFGNPIGHVTMKEIDTVYPELKNLDYHCWIVNYNFDDTKVALIKDLGNSWWHWDGTLLEKREVRFNA